MPKQYVYWTRTTLANDWDVAVATTEHGLCYLALPRDSVQGLRNWVARHIDGSLLQEDPLALEPVVQELNEYFSGLRREFSGPVDLYGTPFQVAVWRALLKIPYGETRSYQDIAIAIGRPNAVRAVGMANGANPVPIVVPCHRVIGKNGSLTGYSGGLDIKTLLLQQEGLLLV